MEENAKTAAGERQSYLVLTRKKAVGWFIIAFIICGWMFVLGVLVGRGTAPIQFDVKQLKKDLVSELTAAIEKEKKQEEAMINTSIEQLASSPKQDLGFYEDLNALKESPENTNIKPVPDTDVIPLQSPQNVDSSEKEPEADKPGTVVAKKPSAPEKTSGPAFTIQVASGKDQKYADKMVDELSMKGYQAYRSSGEIKGKGIWHRVRIGEFNDRAVAEVILKKVKKEKLNGIIVTK